MTDEMAQHIFLRRTRANHADMMIDDDDDDDGRDAVWMLSLIYKHSRETGERHLNHLDLGIFDWLFLALTTTDAPAQSSVLKIITDMATEMLHLGKPSGVPG